MKSRGGFSIGGMRWLAAGMLQLGLAIALFARPDAVTAAPTFTVNNIFDVPADPADTDYSVCRTSAGNSNCTLRAAIMKANHYAGGGVTINIPAGTYTLSIAKVSPNDEKTGDLNITQSMTINGAGMNSTIVDGGGLDRVFTIDVSGVTVVISNMTVQNALASASALGGAVVSNGNLTLNSMHLTKNVTGLGGGLGAEKSTAILNNCLIDFNQTSYGGGIASFSSTLTLNNCTIANNTASGPGGGLYVQSDGAPSAAGTVTFNNTSVSGNHGDNGGGIHISAGLGGPTVTINNSTINANLATTAGGGIYVGKNSTPANSGVLVMNNSTISANSAQGSGGGIMNLGITSLFFVTIAGNLADSDVNNDTGGGIENVSPGTVDVWNSVLAENFSNVFGNDFDGPNITSHDYNYVQGLGFSNGATTHNLIGGDILLDGLRSNGGPTQTRALFVGSPVIDQIPANLCRDSFGTAPIPDQRSVARPVGSTGDMGAFEGSTQPIYGRNLIRNGDAENGGGSPTGHYVITPNWIVTAGQFTTVPYNSPGGYPNTTTDPVPTQHGYNFFAGGADSPSQAYQIINVSVIGGKIDGGAQAYTFSGDFGGYTNDPDAASVTITFLNSSSSPLGSATLGPYPPSDRGSVTGFKNHSTTGVFPVGTRFVKVEVSMIRSLGTTNDSYLDNLSLVLPTPPLLGNVSTRSFVQTGDNVMIGGFVIKVGSPKKVIIRAIGPSLSNFGVANPLQNPTLELHSGNTIIASNDNWGDAVNHQEISNSGFAPNNSLESAILMTLNPGAYTAIVSGVNGGTGVALIEGYDLDHTAVSKFGDISTRSFVQTGDDVLIGGFVVTANGSKNVIVRAIGPSLSNFNVPNSLSDPTLELQDVNGNVLASNDDWKIPAQAQIQATGFAPSNDAESAIVQTLAPGSYTATVRGKNNTTGVALVEVYGLN
jgi:hypothetical protein